MRVRREKCRKKERKQTTQGRDGRTVRRHHTGILGEKCGVSRRPPSGVYHFLSLSAVYHQFLQRPSCHLAFFPLSSFSLLLSLPLTHRSPRPRSETPLSSADLLLSLLLSPFCVNSRAQCRAREGSKILFLGPLAARREREGGGGGVWGRGHGGGEEEQGRERARDRALLYLFFEFEGQIGECFEFVLRLVQEEAPLADSSCSR